MTLFEPVTLMLVISAAFALYGTLLTVDMLGSILLVCLEHIEKKADAAEVIESMPKVRIFNDHP